jgi:cell division protein FtsL
MEMAERKKGTEQTGKISTLYIVFLIVIAAMGITVHINNVLTVNDMVIKNEEMKKKLNKIHDLNESLRTEVEKLSGPQRIIPLAKDLGLESNRDGVLYLDNETK